VLYLVWVFADSSVLFPIVGFQIITELGSLRIYHALDNHNHPINEKLACFVRKARTFWRGCEAGQRGRTATVSAAAGLVKGDRPAKPTNVRNS
jgi:hypothetical protein